MRRIFVGLMVLTMLVVLNACAPAPVPPTPVPTAASTATTVPATAVPSAITITDDAGRQVTLKRLPKRVVSLAPSNTETVYALGKGELVVGVTEYDNFPPEAKDKPKIGGFAKIDLEKVVGLSPDLVLATNIHAKGVVPELEKRGITVVVIEPKNIDEVIAKMATFGKLLGASDEAAKLSAQMQSRVNDVVNKAKTISTKPKPRVFYEIDNTLFTPGPGSFLDDMIVKAGGANIAADARGSWAQLTLEALVSKDPEVILLGDYGFGETADKVKARPGWANIAAVKNGRIVPITNEDVISRPGPRIVEGLELIARAINPDLFK